MADDDCYVDDFDDEDGKGSTNNCEVPSAFSPMAVMSDESVPGDRSAGDVPFMKRDEGDDESKTTRGFQSGSTSRRTLAVNNPSESNASYEKLIAKEGDVAYDSDDGFSQIKGRKTKRETPSPEIAKQQPKYNEDTPPSSPATAKSLTPPSSTKSSPAGFELPPKSTTPTHNADDDENNYSDDFDFGTPTKAETRHVVSPPPMPLVTPKSATTKSASMPVGRDETRSKDDDYKSRKANHAESQREDLREAWTQKAAPPKKQKTTTQKAKEGDLNLDEMSLERQNEDLKKTIEIITKQIGKIVRDNKSQKSKAPRKTSLNTALTNRAQSEYAVVKKENETLNNIFRMYGRVDSLEKRVAAIEAEIEELEAHKKQMQNEIRFNTRRLKDTDTGSLADRRGKIVQQLKVEKNVVALTNKRTANDQKQSGHHKEFLDHQLDRVKQDGEEMDADQLKTIQELANTLEEHQRDIDSLQYRIEVLRKAKESFARGNAQQEKQIQDREDCVRLRREIDLVKDKIDRIDGKLALAKNPEDVVAAELHRTEVREASERSLLEKQEELGSKSIFAQIKKGRESVIASFVSASKTGAIKEKPKKATEATEVHPLSKGPSRKDQPPPHAVVEGSETEENTSHLAVKGKGNPAQTKAPTPAPNKVPTPAPNKSPMPAPTKGVKPSDPPISPPERIALEKPQRPPSSGGKPPLGPRQPTPPPMELPPVPRAVSPPVVVGGSAAAPPVVASWLTKEDSIAPPPPVQAQPTAAPWLMSETPAARKRSPPLNEAVQSKAPWLDSTPVREEKPSANGSNQWPFNTTRQVPQEASTNPMPAASQPSWISNEATKKDIPSAAVKRDSTVKRDAPLMGRRVVAATPTESLPKDGAQKGPATKDDDTPAWLK